jgi:hypothetical protein
LLTLVDQTWRQYLSRLLHLELPQQPVARRRLVLLQQAWLLLVVLVELLLEVLLELLEVLLELGLQVLCQSQLAVYRRLQVKEG